MTLGVRFAESKAGWSKLSGEFYFGTQSYYEIFNLIALDGSATAKLDILYLPEQAKGGMSLGGTSPSTVNDSYTPLATIHLLPNFIWQFATNYFWTGGVIIGYTANGIPTWGASYGWEVSWKARGFIKIAGISKSTSGRGLLPSGGMHVSGKGIVKWGTSYSPSTGCNVSGTAPPKYITYAAVMGGIIIGVNAESIYFPALFHKGSGAIHISGRGDCGFAKITVIPTGGIKIGGAVSMDYRTFWVAVGSIIIGVAANATCAITRAVLQGVGGCSLGTISRYTWGTYYKGSGVVRSSGTGTYRFGTRCIPSGQIKVSGTSKLAWATSYSSLLAIIRVKGNAQIGIANVCIPYKGINIGGTSLVQWGSHYQFTGGVIIGIAANSAYGILDVKIYGNVIIRVSGRALYNLRIPYLPTGKIIVGRYANTDHGIKFIRIYGKGGMFISGTSRLIWKVSRLGSGTIKIGKFANVDAGFKRVILIASGRIKISGTAKIASQFIYITSRGIFVLGSRTICRLILSPKVGLLKPIKIGGTCKPKWRVDYDEEHEGGGFHGGRPDPYKTGFILIGDNCNTDCGITSIWLVYTAHLYVHEPLIWEDILYFPIYDTYFPYEPYTVVHRPRTWDNKFGDIRVNGNLTPSLAMWWDFGEGEIAYVEWQAKLGILYKVSIKKRQLNWESGQPVKVYIDTFNEIYLEHELLTREEALALIAETKPTQVPTAQEFSTNFNDSNRATGQLSNLAVSVRFLVRPGANIHKLAEHYATLTCLRAAGLNDGTVKGLRMTQNRSSGGWTDVLFAFTQVWTKPPPKMPDRGWPRKWSQG